MISLKNVKSVFKKEFLQIMRDKSVLFTNFFIPLFGIPLYFIFAIEAASYMVAKDEKPLKDETVFTISLQGEVDNELKKTGHQHVYLDCTHLDIDRFKTHFPTIYEHCADLHIEIEKDWIPVVPASHYLCGGIVVDIHYLVRP